MTAPDRTGDLIPDLIRYLDVAEENNVFVTIVLWNGASIRNELLLNLILDESKLQSYIENALIVI